MNINIGLDRKTFKHILVVFVIFFSCFSTKSIAQDYNNAIKIDPVLGFVFGNSTVGYERYFSKNFSAVINYHFIHIERSSFNTLDIDGAFTQLQYDNNGHRVSLELRRYFGKRDTWKSIHTFFVAPTTFYGVHTVDYKEKTGTSVGITPANDRFFRELGNGTTDVRSYGGVVYLGSKWTGDSGEFLELCFGGGYRGSDINQIPVEYTDWRQNKRTGYADFENDINGLFTRFVLSLGIHF